MASQTVNSRIALLCYTRSELTNLQTTVLLKGEFLYVSDEHLIYIGDGSTQLSSLEPTSVDLVKYTDVVNDLTTGGTTVPLSAEQGKALKALIDEVKSGDVTVPVATSSVIGGVLSGGDITVDGSGNVTVNSAAEADKLSTAQTITLSGDVSGSASFDGSAGVTITATVTDDSHNHVIDNVDGLQDALDAKAPLASPAFTGTPTAPTATASSNNTQIATTAYVDTAIAAHISEVAGALIYKGAVDDAESLSSSAEAGWTYKASAAFTLGDIEVEAGDLIICSSNDGTPVWDVYQGNIDGAVIGPDTSVADHIAVFDGATGKVVKDGGATIASLKTPASTSADGLMSSTDKAKLDGIASGAEVNQNAFSTVIAGDDNLSATAKTDTLTIAGSGAISVSGTGKIATIAVAAASGSQAGTMSSADFTKLAGIQAGAEVNVQPDWDADSGDAQILNKPSTLPNPQAVSITVGSQGAVSYDGTTARSISITPSTVGAVARVTGTSGNVVAFGASGAIQDTSVVAANILQNTDTLLIQCSLS